MPPSSPPFPIWLVALIPLAFFIIFPLFWCFVVWLISQFSGWSRLAAHYAAKSPPEGKVWSGQFGMVGVASYKGVLTIHAGPAGFYIETPWLFRTGHPRLFIPWADIHDLQFSRLFWGREMAGFAIGYPKLGSMRLPAEIIREAPVPGSN